MNEFVRRTSLLGISGQAAAIAVVLMATPALAQDSHWPWSGSGSVGAGENIPAPSTSRAGGKSLPGRKVSESTRAVRSKPAIVEPKQSEPQAEEDKHAQSWEWGGEKKVASSGRTVVAVDPRLKVREIYVSFTDRRLYYVTKPGEAVAYPIAIPRKQDDWQGVMRVSDKRVNPSWTPTPTMIKENPRLPSYVPGGHPFNPMGVRALYLGSTAYRIHGTDAPWTIGQPVSKGCIRLYNKDVIDLYEQVKLGTRVTVTWDSFGGRLAQGRTDRRRE